MQTVSTLVIWQVVYPVLCSIGFAEPSELEQVRTTCFFCVFTENHNVERKTFYNIEKKYNMKNLKKIILPILIFFAGFMGHAQNYDCNNASMYKMQEVYNENKSGFAIYHRGQDVMAEILSNSSRLLPQACINSWGEYQQFGAKYLYDRFVREYGTISKDYYLENISYLESLRSFNHIVKKNLRSR